MTENEKMMKDALVEYERVYRLALDRYVGDCAKELERLTELGRLMLGA